MQKIVESECVTFFFKQELEEEEKNIGTQFVFQKHLEIRKLHFYFLLFLNAKNLCKCLYIYILCR